MPYKRVGKTVKVLKGNKWVTLKTHATVEAAKKHLTALKINVKK